MSATDRQLSPVPAVDFLFTHMGGGGAPAPVLAAAEKTPAAVGPPPELKSPADWDAARQWLLREKQRLEEFTRQQFAALQAEHQRLLAQNYQNELALALRDRELNQRAELQSAQEAALGQRDRELVRRDAAAAERVRQVEFLKSEIERLQRDRDGLAAEVGSVRDLVGRVEAVLGPRRQDWAAALAAIERRQDELICRFEDLGREESLLQRRFTELHETEERVRRELEARERQLAAAVRGLDCLPDSGATPRSSKSLRTSHPPVAPKVPRTPERLMSH